jgi:hypothetical protein
MSSLCAALEDGAEALARAHAAALALASALDTGGAGPVHDALKAPMNAPSTPLDRHLPRGKIEARSDLERFCMARARTMKFADLATAIVDTFGPQHRVGVSSIHRWWHRRGKTLPPPSIDKS